MTIAIETMTVPPTAEKNPVPTNCPSWATGSGDSGFEAGADGVTIRMLDPSEDADARTWDEAVSGHPEASVFHSSAWARVLIQTYRHRAFYLLLTGSDGETLAMVPLMEVSSPITGRRGVCLPFSDACGPLIFKSSESGKMVEIIAALARERNWKHLEFRGAFEPLTAGAVPSEQFQGHELELGNAAAGSLEEGFSNAVGRAVRKAQRSGLQATVSNSMDALLDYYRLHVRTRRRHGLPPQSRSFFENIGTQLITKGSGFVVTVALKGRPVAGAVFLRFGGVAVYKFGASEKAHWDLRPNNLVMDEAIRSLRENQASALSFGRTAIEDEGLQRFKRGWGARDTAIPYWRFDREMLPLPPVHRSPSRLCQTVFENLPLSVNRLAGALIYPHLD